MRAAHPNCGQQGWRRKINTPTSLSVLTSDSLLVTLPMAEPNRKPEAKGLYADASIELVGLLVAELDEEDGNGLGCKQDLSFFFKTYRFLKKRFT